MHKVAGFAEGMSADCWLDVDKRGRQGPALMKLTSGPVGKQRAWIGHCRMCQLQSRK